MAKMRGAQATSPSVRNTRLRASPARDSMSEAPQASAKPSEGGVPPSPPQRRYETRRPPTTPRARNSRPRNQLVASFKESRAEIPTEIIPPAPTTPSIVSTPEATSSAPPTTLETPPVIPATSAPPPSESTITISASELRGLCHTLQTLTTTQSHDMPGPSKPTDPSQEPLLVEQTIPHEETTTVEIETLIQSTHTTTIEPLSPHDPHTTT
ncbi:hypothetical protein AAG906_010540 [Vitis piasezkii]